MDKANRFCKNCARCDIDKIKDFLKKQNVLCEHVVWYGINNVEFSGCINFWPKDKELPDEK